MKKKDELPIWTQEEPDICRFCAFARVMEVTEEIYCEKKKKFTEFESTCKKFRYDILKKTIGKRRKMHGKYEKKDFEL